MASFKYHFKSYLDRLVVGRPKHVSYEVKIELFLEKFNPSIPSWKAHPESFMVEVNEWLNENDIDCWFTHYVMTTQDKGRFSHFSFYFTSSQSATLFRLRWG